MNLEPKHNQAIRDEIGGRLRAFAVTGTTGRVRVPAHASPPIRRSGTRFAFDRTGCSLRAYQSVRGSFGEELAEQVFQAVVMTTFCMGGFNERICGGSLRKAGTARSSLGRRGCGVQVDQRAVA